jgi:(p)ppGpp synthase/HD superfamily hydrolase
VSAVTENELLAKAIRIAAAAFEGTMDKGGSPYILHCLAVMQGVRHLGFGAMAAAVLHDLLEDRPEWSAQRLRDEDFPEDLVRTVELLTRSEGEDYQAYIARLAPDAIARAIKIADLSHNMDPARLPDLSEHTMERMRKYHTAYCFLTKGR